MCDGTFMHILEIAGIIALDFRSPWLGNICWMILTNGDSSVPYLGRLKESSWKALNSNSRFDKSDNVSIWVRRCSAILFARIYTLVMQYYHNSNDRVL